MKIVNNIKAEIVIVISRFKYSTGTLLLPSQFLIQTKGLPFLYFILFILPFYLLSASFDQGLIQAFTQIRELDLVSDKILLILMFPTRLTTLIILIPALIVGAALPLRAFLYYKTLDLKVCRTLVYPSLELCFRTFVLTLANLLFTAIPLAVICLVLSYIIWPLTPGIIFFTSFALGLFLINLLVKKMLPYAISSIACSLIFFSPNEGLQIGGIIAKQRYYSTILGIVIAVLLCTGVNFFFNLVLPSSFSFIGAVLGFAIGVWYGIILLANISLEVYSLISKQAQTPSDTA